MARIWSQQVEDFDVHREGINEEALNDDSKKRSRDDVVHIIIDLILAIALMCALLGGMISFFDYTHKMFDRVIIFAYGGEPPAKPTGLNYQSYSDCPPLEKIPGVSSTSIRIADPRFGKHDVIIPIPKWLEPSMLDKLCYDTVSDDGYRHSVQVLSRVTSKVTEFYYFDDYTKEAPLLLGLVHYEGCGRYTYWKYDGETFVETDLQGLGEYVKGGAYL